LAQVGHRGRSDEDGCPALVQIGEELAAICLSDLNIPGMNGFAESSAMTTKQDYPSRNTHLNS
ncbi:MAG: hypothetical protein WCA37_01800, partial [Terracidiphilus sp.]